MDYKNGKIYKIVCDTTGLVYIGATTQPALSTRLGQHVTRYKSFVKTGVNKKCTSISVIENGNYKIFLIEKVPCDTKDELSRRERFHIEANVCVNKIIPLRTDAEYRQDNAVHIREQKKEYRQDNAVHIREHNKDYYKKNIDKRKEYRELNADHIREQKKTYNKLNADNIRERQKTYYQNKKLQNLIEVDT